MAQWKELFSSEEELVKALMQIDPEKYQRKWYRGHSYIQPFQTHYNKHGELTKKQLTTVKRLAWQISQYHTNEK